MLPVVCGASRAAAQPDVEALEEERAGGSRGGSYAWGDSTTDVPSSSGPATHRYARIFGTVGAGVSFRILIYADALSQTEIAPAYLQLRGGYFFEGDGDIQHGIGLGISVNMTGDGAAFDRPGEVNGMNPFSAWTFTPQYLLRGWFSDWLQLIGRVGVSATAALLPNWGFEVAIQPVLKILSGFGFYVDAGFSMFFSDTVHPLISIEGGLVFDYELLP
jgi:hypothetical protein